MKIIAIIVVIIFVIVLAVLVLLDEFGKQRDTFLIFVIVPPKYVYIRLRFGKIYNDCLLNEGYHLFIPGIDSIYSKVSLKLQDLNFEPSNDSNSEEKDDSQEFMFKDRIEGKLKWTIRCKVEDARRFALEHSDPFKALENECSKIARESLAELTSEEITNALNIINARFESSLDKMNNEMQIFGIKVKAVFASKVDFSKEHEKFLQKMNELQMEAEAKLRAADIKLQAEVKDSEIYIEMIKRLKEMGITDKATIEAVMNAVNLKKTIEKGGVKSLILPAGDASIVGSLTETVKAVKNE